LWDVFSKGYDVRTLHKDVFAGIIVGIVALPLSVALR
jgi:MFS superfamily sulfate permease-like transporter